MAKYTANGGKFQFDTTGLLTTNPGPLDCPYISAKYAGGECAEVDVTGSSFGSLSPGRKYVKGLGAGRTIEIECYLDDGVSSTNEISTSALNEMKDFCGDLALNWLYGEECGVAATNLSATGKLYDFSLDSDLDGAVKCTMTWRLSAAS
tara:strand:+ start:3733 stop:4179 length:447 start_codon:yes stop_codon:yes gene_type:complete